MNSEKETFLLTEALSHFEEAHFVCFELKKGGKGVLDLNSEYELHKMIRHLRKVMELQSVPV
jgi:hypothetical protein